ncbi:MAG: hypothetical protein QOJ09_409 [Actinomycetota bacterium]|nr:hypothetical protein [Actinomycetota bacterium]
MAVEEPVGPGDLRLRELYAQYGPALLRLCTRRLGDPSRAEDACHEALMRAHGAADRFRAGAPVWPWLATIAINVCTDMDRRDHRVAFMAQPPDVMRAPDAAAVADGHSRRELVRDSLRSLPVSYRRSVFLHYFAGRSYDEIAEDEGTSVAAVRSRLLRARRLLRTRIEQTATARGEWPLPVAWLRGQATRARLTIGRIDATLGRSVESAAPYAAALLFALGLGTTGAAGADAPNGPTSQASFVAGRTTSSVPLGQGGIAAVPPVGRARVSHAPPPPPPIPSVHAPLLEEQRLHSPVRVIPGDDQTLLYFGWSCTGENQPGPVTKKLCETFPEGFAMP